MPHRSIGRYTGIPIVRIDEEMCREAARLGDCEWAYWQLLPTTLEPTKNTVARVAREMNQPCRPGGRPGGCIWCGSG